MLSNMVILAFFVAVVTFVYHSIIAPTLRDNARYKLFALRDKLRKIHYEQGEKCSDELFSMLDEGISRWINRLSLVTLSLMIRVRQQMRTDRDFQKSMGHARKLLQQCELPEVQEISRDVDRTIMLALAYNSAGWFPIIVVVLLVSSITVKISQTASSLVLMGTDDGSGLSSDFAVAH